MCNLNYEERWSQFIPLRILGPGQGRACQQIFKQDKGNNRQHPKQSAGQGVFPSRIRGHS